MGSLLEESVSDRARVLRALAAADWSASGETEAPFDAEKLAASGIELVKTGDCRAVYRVDAPEGPVYLKHSWSRGWLARLWDRLRGTPSRREFLRSREAERRGIPTTHPLAFAEALHAGAWDGLLVTRELREAVPLDRFYELHEERLAAGTTDRRNLVIALASLCAKTHEAGVEHLDLHAGNIMVVWPSDEASPRLYLIDLDKSRFGKPLGWRASRRNLAMLLCGLHHVADRRDTWRFWRHYRNARPSLGHLARKQAHDVWRRGSDRVFAVLKDRDRRALRENRQFLVLRGDAGVAFGIRGESPAVLANLLRAPNVPLQRPGMEAMKISLGSVVVKTQIPGEEREIVYKRMRGKTWRKRLVALFRPSRARLAWQRGHALLARGIATAKPLFALEPRPTVWWGESFLATEWIEGTENLHLYLWRLAKQTGEERAKKLRQSAVALGALLGKMHSYGVSQRDLKGCNLAVVENEELATWYLLDLEGVRIKRRLSLHERAENLGRLAASAEVHPCLSRADRMRFLRAYAEAAGYQDDLPKLWRTIAADCRQQLARLERQGRRIA